MINLKIQDVLKEIYQGLVSLATTITNTFLGN